jgi:hypothetical protein
MVCSVLFFWSCKVSKAGSGVLCTIHQPSSEIFEQFDYWYVVMFGFSICFTWMLQYMRSILMHAGRIVYTGELTQVVPHFSTHGFPVRALNDQSKPTNAMQIKTNQNRKQRGSASRSKQASDQPIHKAWKIQLTSAP